VKAEPGASGLLVQKMGEAGYALTVGADGTAVLTVKGPHASARLVGKQRVNDGRWHHVLAEVDRPAGKLRLYVDGTPDARGSGIGADVSLANAADLYVGGAPDGGCLACTIDFLRMAQGTLADADTTIGELYAWEFDGPFLQDFTGRQRDFGRSAAGAIDLGTER